MSTGHPDRERCGYLIRHSSHALDDTESMWRISKDGWSCYQTPTQMGSLDALSDDDFEWLLAAWREQTPKDGE